MEGILLWGRDLSVLWHHVFSVQRALTRPVDLMSRCAALGMSLALCVAPQNHLKAKSPDSNERDDRELKSCMARIEFVEPMLTLQPELIACLQTAGERNPGARAFGVQSRPAPQRLPDGRRYGIIGAARHEVYAELKDYPDEVAIGHVGEELRRLACKKSSDAILKAGISCGPCPDREDLVPCVFAEGHFIVWMNSEQGE